LSHGRPGQCWDNALAESFFGSIKGELTDLQPWPAGVGASAGTSLTGEFSDRAEVLTKPPAQGRSVQR